MNCWGNFLEKYYGRKIDFKKMLKASFGDYVQAIRINDTGNLE